MFFHRAGSLLRRLPSPSQSQKQSWYSTTSKQYEAVIGGGGIMGLSSAFFLAQRIPPDSICIVERDPKYKQASTPLSVGSIRQQFSIPANIQLSLYSSGFIQNIAEHLQVEGSDPPDVQFVSGGYMFLATREGESTLRENVDTQRTCGAAVELMEPFELKERYPWINTDGIVLASIGTRNEGWFDPWLLLSAFKKKVLSMGVHYINGEVTNIVVDNNRVRSVQVTHPNQERENIQCGNLLNSAGPWAAQFAYLAGVGDHSHSNIQMHTWLPVKPRRRCVFFVRCPSVGDASFPMLINADGVYVRREGADNTFICGVSPPEHLDHDDLELEVDYSLFEDYIWPSLAQRISAFESLKLQSSWAGYYDFNTLDQNAIIGRHPVITNLIFANGFSGHGIQQSPAVGRAVSEVILDGISHSIDLSRFSFKRIIQQQPYKEKNIV